MQARNGRARRTMTGRRLGTVRPTGPAEYWQYRAQQSDLQLPHVCINLCSHTTPREYSAMICAAMGVVCTYRFMQELENWNPRVRAAPLRRRQGKPAPGFEPILSYSRIYTHINCSQVLPSGLVKNLRIKNSSNVLHKSSSSGKLRLGCAI